MTTEQAKSYQAHLTASAKAYNERTLMTREMREAAELEKANKRVFTKVPASCTVLTKGDVRIRFPDGVQIQGTFGVDETVGDIYQFVREQLAFQDVGFQLRMVKVNWVDFRSFAEWCFGGFGVEYTGSGICATDVADGYFAGSTVEIEGGGRRKCG
jgi:hypothetical protein